MSIPIRRLVFDGLRSLFLQPPVGTGGTVSARYCYSVFMRQRVVAAQYGLSGNPRVIIELGPGDSLGIGLMAILTGSERYVAIDAVRHASVETNLAIFDELVALLTHRASIPVDGVCAEIRPELGDYDFPHAIFDDSSLDAALAPARVDKFRKQLLTVEKGGAVEYAAPFGEMGAIASESVDWIFSQAVLEHVDQLGETYAQCYRCLKPGGIMTHQIDYRCHETAQEWNGHWKYPQWFWGVMRGRRPWFVNRLPHSAHRRLQQQAGFEVRAEILQKQESAITREQLAKSFKSMSDADMETAGAMCVSIKVLKE